MPPRRFRNGRFKSERPARDGLALFHDTEVQRAARIMAAHAQATRKARRDIWGHINDFRAKLGLPPWGAKA